MSRKNIESAIGRIATDEELRARFREAPERTLRELAGQGLALTPGEIERVIALGARTIDAIAGAIDPRLEKASLKVKP